MADSIVSQFRREYALPIETTRQVSTISQRDAISTLRRWEGMLVYVVTEGVTYILQGGTDNTSWIPLVGLSDAPVDGQSYVRKDGNWSLLPNILPDAPEDGETYGRKDGTWQQISSEDAVTDVFGRTGSIEAEEGDYDAFYAPIGVSTDSDNSLSLGTDDKPYFKERTAAEIATDYESNADTNKFTDADKSAVGSAVQPVDLAAVATTGSYNDLGDKPEIPDISGKVDKEVVTKGLFTGPIDLSKIQGSVYSDYDVSVNGTINFSIASGAVILGVATMAIISDGLTPFATEENLNAVFFTKLGVPIDYVLPSGTFEAYFWKTPKGISISIPANNSASGGSINLLLISAKIENDNRNKILLAFNRLLNESSIPDTTDFTVTGGKTVTDVDVIGSIVYVTLDGNFGPTSIIEISYAKGTNPIEDTVGVDTADFSDRPVTNNITGDVIQSTTGLMLYLDGSDADTIDGTSPDFVWHDKSSFENHASQAGTSYIPYDSVNKSVGFSGDDKLLLSSPLLLSSREYTVFMVIDFGPSFDDVPFGRSVDDVAGAGMYWRAATNTITFFTGAESSIWAISDWGPYSGKKVFIIDADKMFINGVIAPDSRTNYATPVTLTLDVIGYSKPQVNKALSGSLYSIGFFNRLLSTAEKDNINSLLMSKFDIT